MRPEDVYALTSVGDPRLSPDGRLVAYVVTRIDREANRYRTAIWVAPLDGPRSHGSSPRASAATARRAGLPTDAGSRSSPIATARRRRRKAQLYVLPADGGEPRKLTDGNESVDSIAWSPDSRRIAFARRVPRRRVRGGGRAQARAAPLHARLLQARQRRLDRRPPQAPLRRRPRGRRRAAAHGRRLRERRAGVVARRQPHRLHLACAATAGTSSSSTRCTSSTSTPRAPSRDG